MSEHFDVVIIGAGLSGIGAGYHLQTQLPGKTYCILESREAIGGTWDLFKYPGLRSDSDMYTLGYAFKPWTEGKAIADGASILNYIRETATDNGIDRHIRFRHAVKRLAWSSASSRWTIEAERDGEPTTFTAGFVFTCTGYYDYDGGYMPAFAGAERFKGRLVHPQQWPADLDYAGKRVVVIGSGATAVTLVPAMAQTADHVTMLQRSPSYVVSMPARDKLADRLRAKLPANLAYALIRWRNVLITMLFYKLARSRPEKFKARVIGMVQKALGPAFDVATHFTPRYKPWDQRLCLVPDSDLFRSLKKGKAEMATDTIDTFTETGIKLSSGRELAADVVVAATGLKLKLLGGMALEVDGKPIDLAETMTYKGMMYSGVPNLATALGYTNASWTLKCDLTCAYVCRLIAYMDKKGYASCMPRLDDASVTPAPLIDFSSGYIQRAIEQFPKQGSKTPWRLYQNYVLDWVALKLGSVDDRAMAFSRGGAGRTA